jgi:hypothetical protein
VSLCTTPRDCKVIQLFAILSQKSLLRLVQKVQTTMEQGDGLKRASALDHIPERSFATSMQVSLKPTTWQHSRVGTPGGCHLTSACHITAVSWFNSFRQANNVIIGRHTTFGVGLLASGGASQRSVRILST